MTEDPAKMSFVEFVQFCAKDMGFTLQPHQIELLEEIERAKAEGRELDLRITTVRPLPAKPP